MTGLVLVLVLGTPAAAGPEDLANDISAEVMSPFCPGVTLHDCSSEEANELRARIEGWARAGWTRSRIMRELEAEFGSSIAAAPPRRGSNLIAWLLPAVVLAAGAGGAWLVARRMTSRGATGPTAPTDQELPLATPAERARLGRELASHRAER
ncbi:MAG: cytochrome c-type biogenesis protein CcmH [Actinomycetota bacterium]|nr:cytochrome c-type biogenesis protein CcmH [Actinomycetota bacterium]